MTHRVVIIGGGYAGIPAARRLARQVRPEEVSVTLISAFADFVERPRLHQLAAGQQIAAVPLRDFLARSGVEVMVGSVVRLDLPGRSIDVVGEAGQVDTIGYDTLVYALGSNIDVTSVPGIAEHGTALTGTAAARRLGTRLASLAESAGSVTVCGGGLTGLEVAAEIAEAYPAISTRLVTAGTPGGWFSPKARDYLSKTFTDLGVDVTEGARIRRVEAGELILTDGARLPFGICVWAGGFSVPDLARVSGLAVGHDGRALVDSTLESVSHPGVYVIGDAASIAIGSDAQLAMGCRSGGFTGPAVADIIAARLTGREAKPFRYRYFHECLSLGRRHGLIQFLNADESPKARVLTGRKAILYKNLVLDSAKVIFRHSGPAFRRRRSLIAGAACHTEPRSTVSGT